MAGLLSARVLSERFARVILVERGDLPDGPVPRRAVPQGAHVHGVLAGGLEAMRGLYPELAGALRRDGACFGDLGTTLDWHHFGVRKRQVQVGVEGVLVSRPCLESHVRRLTRALPGVEVRTGCKAIALVAEERGNRVRGLRVATSEARIEEIEAALVVDASGRGAAAPGLLRPLGVPPAPESQIKMGMGYATRAYRRARGNDFKGAMVTPLPPRETRGAVLFAVEGERWLCTLSGYVGDHPPADEAGYLAFARSLPMPQIYETISQSTPLGDIAVYKFPSSLRRHYERLRLPEGFVVVGDALCSFNPVYGQGMTVAALEALALRDELARTGSGMDGLSRRFQRRAAKIVDVPWSLAAGEDLRYPQVEGPRLPSQRLINRYTARVHRATAVDEVVMTAFLKVMHFLAPPASLFAPRILWRAWRAGAVVEGGVPALLASDDAEAA